MHSIFFLQNWNSIYGDRNSRQVEDYETSDTGDYYYEVKDDSDDLMTVRIALLISNLPWVQELKDTSSVIFKEVSSNLKSEIGNLYANFPGRQIVTVLNFDKASRGTMVKVDLSTTSSVNDEKMKFVFESQLQKKIIGPYQVETTNANWWRVISQDGKLFVA